VVHSDDTQELGEASWVRPAACRHAESQLTSRQQCC
jgi:hypothetical protein